MRANHAYHLVTFIEPLMCNPLALLDDALSVLNIHKIINDIHDQHT